MRFTGCNTRTTAVAWNTRTVEHVCGTRVTVTADFRGGLPIVAFWKRVASIRFAFLPHGCDSETSRQSGSGSSAGWDEPRASLLEKRASPIRTALPRVTAVPFVGKIRPRYPTTGCRHPFSVSLRSAGSGQSALSRRCRPKGSKFRLP